MSTSRLLAILALVLTISRVGRAGAGELRFRFVFEELPNLVYELDCMSGVVRSCSRAAFEPTWAARLLQTADDRAALARWATLARKYERSIELINEPPAPDPEHFSLLKRLRIAGMLARSADDYSERIGLLVLPGDRAAFVEIIRRFGPRFHAFFEGEAAIRGRRFAEQMQQTLTRPDLLDLIDRFRVFYGSTLAEGSALPLVLIYRPESDAKQTYGEQVDGVSVLEFRSGDAAADRVDVAIHELCHFFSSTTPPAVLAHRAMQFRQSKALGAVAASRLFEEAGATALGNGLAGRLVGKARWNERLHEERGLYADPDVDRAAKALFPWLEGVIAVRGAFDADGMVDYYVTLLSQAFGPSMRAPRIALRTSFLFEETGLGEGLLDELRHRASTNSLTATTGEVDAEDLDDTLRSVAGAKIIAVRTRSLPTIARHLALPATAVRAMRDKTPAIYTTTWRGDALYVIAAADEAGAIRALDALCAANTWTDGLVHVR